MNTPSAEALRLAIALSGHQDTKCLYGAKVCEGCIADARIIDATLQLPARNAALLLAQGICDSFGCVCECTPKERDSGHRSDCSGAAWESAIDELREALSRIKTP